jgi:AcrR family transcriptional regulator
MGRAGQSQGRRERLRQGAGKQEAKSALARERICRAVTDCLVELGYADTSINRVVERAGLSKGALQHHFRSKEDLMAATAAWLLGNATFLHIRNTRGPRADRSTERELKRIWQRGANTSEFRALLEILVKMRTDAELRERLAPALRAWHEQSAALTREGYEAASGREEDVDLLMAMHACLIRGLVIQEQYTDDPKFVARILERWIEIVSPLLLPRDAPGN